MDLDDETELARREIDTADELDAKYLDPTEEGYWRPGKGRRFPDRPAQVRTYWGEANPEERKQRRMAHLGIIGRYIRPVTSCLILRSKGEFTPSEISRTLLEILHRSNGSSDGVDQPAFDDDDVSNLLWQRPKRPYPPVSMADAIVNALLLAARQFDSGFAPDLVKETLADLSLRSPSAAFFALWRALPKWCPPLRTYIAPKLISEDDDVTPRHASHLAAIERGLVSGKRNEQIQFVVGSSNEGKSRLVKDLLRAGLKGKYGPAARYTIVNHPEIDLPVFALSCRDLTYAQIIESVYRFLMGQPPLDAAALSEPSFLNTLPAREALELIRAGARTDALYVLTDLTVFEPGNVRRALQGEGIGRLVLVLAQRSPRTRIILASTHAPNDPDANYQGRQRLHDAKTHEIEPPQIDELIALLDKDGATWVTEALASDEFAKERKAHQGRDLVKMPVAGHLLHAALAAFQIADEVEIDVLKHLVSHTAVSQTAPLPKNNEDTFFKSIWTFLAGHLSLDALRALYLIAASDDGYTSQSLEQALSIWRDLEGGADDPERDPEVDPEGDNAKSVFAKLDDMATRNGDRMLRRSAATRLSRHEKSASELLRGKSELTIKYEFDSPMQRGLSSALKALDPHAYSTANLITAGIARQRALNVKTRLSRRYGQSRGDLRRDLQAYSCLLAAQGGADKKSREERTRSPFGGESRIFCPFDRVEQRDALLHAYHVMFRTEIDTGNRLTMVFDDDALRLDLLLSLVLGVGRRFWTLRPDTVLPANIPPHIHATFLDEEIAEILLAIALTAHYCNKPAITDWAAEHLKNLEGASDERSAIKVQMLCVQADNVVFGPPPDNKNRQLQLDTMRTEKLGLARKTAAQIVNPALRLKAMSRVSHRIFQHEVASGDKKGANETFADIVKTTIEARSANPSESENLGGMAAISLMRTLFGDPALDRPVWTWLGWNSEYTLAVFDDLIAAAAARLSRYGGVERANVAMSRAYRAAIAGEFDEATVLAELARDNLQIPSGSPGFHTTVMWGSAQIQYMAGEANPDRRRRLWLGAYDDAQILYGQTDYWEFVTYQAKASLFMSKILARYPTIGDGLSFKMRHSIPVSITHLEKMMKRGGEIAATFVSDQAPVFLKELEDRQRLAGLLTGG